MSFGESGYKFGDANPFKPLQGVGKALGGLMDAHRDMKNTEIENQGKGAGLALQTHLNLEAGMIDREHMVHVFGTQLKPHMKAGSNINYQSGNHTINGTFAGAARKPKDPNAPAKPAGGSAKPPLTFEHKDSKGKVTGTSTQVFPAPVNVETDASGKPTATATNKAATKANSQAKPAAKTAAKKQELTPAQKRAATIAAKKKADPAKK